MDHQAGEVDLAEDGEEAVQVDSADSLVEASEEEVEAVLGKLRLLIPLSRYVVTLQQIKAHTERIFSRSSGPGGQHVNKTSTRVQLTFNILASRLDDMQKKRLLRKYKNGFIRVENQETRSQTQNTRLAYDHLLKLIESALFVPKKRKKKKAPHLTKSGKLKKMMKDKLMKYKKRRIEM